MEVGLVMEMVVRIWGGVWFEMCGGEKCHMG